MPFVYVSLPEVTLEIIRSILLKNSEQHIEVLDFRGQTCDTFDWLTAAYDRHSGDASVNEEIRIWCRLKHTNRYDTFLDEKV